MELVGYKQQHYAPTPDPEPDPLFPEIDPGPDQSLMDQQPCLF